MYEVPPSIPPTPPAHRSVGTDLWLLITTGLGALVGGVLVWEGVQLITHEGGVLAYVLISLMVFSGPGALLLTFTVSDGRASWDAAPAASGRPGDVLDLSLWTPIHPPRIHRVSEYVNCPFAPPCWPVGAGHSPPTLN